MNRSNPLNSFIRLISLEGVFQPLPPKSKLQTQEMRIVTLSQEEIETTAMEREQRRTQMLRQYERLAQHQTLIDVETEAERISQ
jgi:hypothetical protein